MLSGRDAEAPARIEVTALAAIVGVSALLTVVPHPHGVAP